MKIELIGGFLKSSPSLDHDPSLKHLLNKSARMHRHLCPRQVLGVRMGLFAGKLLSIGLPQNDKRLLVISEIDGCTVDGISVATNCWIGRRTLRIEDYGKIAATFIDTKTEVAYRIIPRPSIRRYCEDHVSNVKNRWQAHLVGYQLLADDDLLYAQRVELTQSLEKLISKKSHKTKCSLCSEEINNEREVIHRGLPICKSCAGFSYYSVLSE